ncbi:MAG: DUF2147 domain-containing protein [Rhizobiales bacterium]|nr:DUF2147 domain-containing protein [Hyphomicrobiales bacterium]
MKLARLSLVAALCAFAFPSIAQDADKVAGVWQSQSGITRVKVLPCGTGLCGHVVWQKNPSKDVHNPDPSKRERPIVGLQLVSNMKPVGPGEWSGSIYNYEDGKTYQGKVKAAGNAIEIGGCVMGGMICQSKTWTKVN